jgi:hypothetical protein
MEQLPALKPATNTTNNPTARPTLEEVRRRFETWRRKRKHGSRIPNCLWKAAVEVCAAHRVWQVSKVLGLSYNDLKRRVLGTGQIEKMPTPAKADFVVVCRVDRPLGTLPRTERTKHPLHIWRFHKILRVKNIFIFLFFSSIHKTRRYQN